MIGFIPDLPQVLRWPLYGRRNVYVGVAAVTTLALIVAGVVAGLSCGGLAWLWPTAAIVLYIGIGYVVGAMAIMELIELVP